MGWLISVLEKLGIMVEEKPDLDIIHINDLQEWARVRTEEIVSQASLNEELINYINKLKDKRWTLECKIDDWEKKINSLGLAYKTEDIKSIFNETRKFLELLTFTDENTVSNTLALNSRLEACLERLQKQVEESSFAHNYSFVLSKEEKGLAINPLLKEFIEVNHWRENFENKIVKSGFGKMEILRKKAAALEESRDKLKRLKEELAVKSERLERAKEKVQEKEKELCLLSEDPKCAQLAETKSKEKDLLAKREELEDRVFIFFSKLKPALEDYSKLDPQNKLASGYVNDPVKTFSQDAGLAVLNFLKMITELLIGGKITLNAEQNNLFMERLKFANSGELEDLQQEYLNLQQELKEVKEQPMTDKDFSLRMEEAKYRLEHFSKQQEDLQREGGNLKEEIDDNIALWNKELELFKNLVLVTLGKEIEVKV